MADVYLAENPRIKQQVAIKVMRAELIPYKSYWLSDNGVRRAAFDIIDQAYPETMNKIIEK